MSEEKTGDGPAPRAAEGMAGLAKGLAIIESFGKACSQVTVADAARATGVSRAAARRCLLTLAELGYLTFDGKHFRATPRMLRLGASYLDSAPLPQIAQTHLEAARDRLDESVSLAVIEDGFSVFVARAEADHIVSTGVRVGARLPAYCTATGRVLLSGMTDAELHAYLDRCDFKARTNRTLVERGAIENAVERARSNGYDLTDEELELGMRSIAVGVRDPSGTVIAAISASAYSARITLDAMISNFLPVLREQAQKIGRAM
ncbi:MAG: IclR family transcriptional regulator, pca regulon regulatory protein [Sphingomonadales bacterium]|jgi:IclR family pca regulon transcriptional regulator|nr:IclR family transcriptional regulator, pca regulon regulatory protein [Sphingomonadales bacterium]